MRVPRLLLTGVLLTVAGCASPVPTTTPTPSSSSVAVATTPAVATATPALVTPTPGPSPVPILHTSITCLPETGPLPAGLRGDPCPSAITAIRTAVASLGSSIARIYIEPGPFNCGDLWPGVGSPVICFGALIQPGRTMHGWVSFDATDKIAAVALDRSPNKPWTAKVLAFEVPPAGWVMP